MFAAGLEGKDDHNIPALCKDSVRRLGSVDGFQMESPKNPVDIPAAENPDAPFQS